MTFLQSFRAQQAAARREFKQLAKLFPGAFDKNGKPLVATLTFPGKSHEG